MKDKNTKKQSLKQSARCRSGKGFLPDAPLLNLALNFSDNYNKLPVAEYFSYDLKYHIRYLKQIPGYNTGARISNTTGIIELDRTRSSKTMR